MDATSLCQVITAVVGVAGSIAGVWLGARIQRGQGKEIERDRLRHDVASRTAEERLRAYVTLANKVAQAYRSKMNTTADRQAMLDEAKNYYFDHRFFFSPAIGHAFREVAESLSLVACSREILHSHLNALYSIVRDDLMLPDLAESVQRAVSKEQSAANAAP